MISIETKTLESIIFSKSDINSVGYLWQRICASKLGTWRKVMGRDLSWSWGNSFLHYDEWGKPGSERYCIISNLRLFISMSLRIVFLMSPRTETENRFCSENK